MNYKKKIIIIIIKMSLKILKSRQSENKQTLKHKKKSENK